MDGMGENVFAYNVYDIHTQMLDVWSIYLHLGSLGGKRR